MATLNANLTDDGGQPCSSRFRYGVSPTVLVEATPYKTGMTTGDSISMTISTFPGTTYYFQAEATNDVGTSTGAILSFTTSGSSPPATVLRPEVMTNSATDITENKMTLNSTLIDGKTKPCKMWFEWGLTKDYGMVTSTVYHRSTGDNHSVSIGQLAPGRAIHFRAVASNIYGTGYGNDKVATTLSEGHLPVGIADEIVTLMWR